MRRLAKLAIVLACTVFVPAAAYGQASIVGVVKDTSGAVLPGVTVEAASPALIEKVRSVVTDGTGQYRIENLRPGTYTVTFTLPGFSTVKREGIALTGSFVASVNTDLRVGAVEETITVTGETPVVDVQSTTRQRVMDREILDTIPSGGNAFSLGVLIPGVNSAGRQDVGGAGTRAVTSNMTVHGSRNADAGTTLSGVSISSLGSSSATATIRLNPIALQEIVIDTAAPNAELHAGGVRINYIPKDGGNEFHGTIFGAFANGAMQGSNFTEELRNRGLSSPNAINKNWDINPGFGGPLKRDRLWFYGAARYSRTSDYAAGLFHNRNANNPNAWTFDPDFSRQVTNDARNPDGQLRLTWQATQKHKIGLLGYDTTYCFCPTDADATNAFEAASRRDYPLQRLIQADWTAPLTSRLLFEAGAMAYFAESNDVPWRELNPAMIPVTEQSSGLNYRAGDPYRILRQRVKQFRGAVSYITGAHALKVGMNHKSGNTNFYGYDNQPGSYRFNNGVPNRITQRAYPFNRLGHLDHDLGLFAQDKWTVRGLTFSYGLRYDYVANSFPEQPVGPARLAPTRNITFPAQENIAYHDLSPRLGASYDPFGTGKTAIKVSLNQYLLAVGIDSTFGGNANPVNNLIVQTNRSWRDANRDFVPDCDLLNPRANGECGAMDNSDFGQVGFGSGGARGRGVGATYDPDLLRGWGRREKSWEFSAGLQQELLPRVSGDVSYFRRWFGNFAATDNRATDPADFDPFSITAPADPRLPGGGGYMIDGLYDLKPAKFGVPVDNFVTRAENYGNRIEYWHGVDLTLNARPGSSVLLQGGVSTGRTVTDNCEIVAKLDNPSTLYCHVITPFLTQFKFLGTYTIPRVEVQVSGTFQSLPGPEIAANYNAPNAVVAASLGRNLAGGARNVTVNLVEPGTMYGDRLNQLDLRASKILRFGRTSTRVNVDFYNALNSNAVLTQNNNFAAWRQPTLILLARFVKLSAQFDF